MNPSTQRLFDAITSYPLGGAAERPDQARRSLVAIKAALRSGASLTAMDPNGRTAPFCAATRADPQPLELLRRSGLDLHVASKNDGTLLHRAAAFGCVTTINRLIELGLPVDARDGQGRTPLDCARQWKHGSAAIPLLSRLMKSSRPKTASRSEPEGDLHQSDVRRALQVLSPPIQKAMRRFARAFFIELDPRRTTKFLQELSDQDNPSLLSAGQFVVRRATRAKPVRRKARRVGRDTVHLGDLEVQGDVEVDGCLIVTGNLTVHGRLKNFEGTVISVGGDLRARAVWTEGPLDVGGDLLVERCVYGFYNDYSARVGGVLVTSILVEDDHSVKARALRLKKHFRSRKSIPSPVKRSLKRDLRCRLER